jgi:hypothetical protein
VKRCVTPRRIIGGDTQGIIKCGMGQWKGRAPRLVGRGSRGTPPLLRSPSVFAGRQMLLGLESCRAGVYRSATAPRIFRANKTRCWVGRSLSREHALGHGSDYAMFDRTESKTRGASSDKSARDKA